ncbi:MAG: hypothetical protein J1E64_14385, partial [Acetatifactor sp.]|nr:hypothetical protein [Acetatifactor sp.]
LLIGRELDQKVGGEGRKSKGKGLVFGFEGTRPLYPCKKSRFLLFFCTFHNFIEKNIQILNFIVSFSGKYVIIGLSEQKSLERFSFYRIFVWSNSF